MMKVLHLTMNDNSGAGRAVLRLHQGLRRAGIDSSILVAGRYSSTPFVYEPSGWIRYYKKLQSAVVNSLVGRRLGSREGIFSVNSTPSLLAGEIRRADPDILHLHWIGWEYLRIEEVNRFTPPVVWTLHDMWAFTGGCHVDGGCGRYRKECGECPVLVKKGGDDLSHRVWERKARSWQKLGFHIAAPSRWMSECVRQSSLFRERAVSVMPNGLDTDIFKPVDKKMARRVFNLDETRKLLLTGVDKLPGPHHKGFHHLQKAIDKLGWRNNKEDIELVIFGVDEPQSPPELGLRVRYLGRFNDDISLALLYSAADLFVAPSVQDNLPNTVMESLACGTPVVAFSIGGIPDMVEHRQNGYLARPFEPEDMAKGIEWVLEDPLRCRLLGERGREKAVREYSLETVSKRYAALYRELLEQ